MAYENFIGGAWKAAGSGATDQVLDPATGEVDRRGAVERRQRRRCGGGRRHRGVRELGQDHAPRTQREAAGARRRGREEHRRAQATRDAQCRQSRCRSSTSSSTSRSTTFVSSPAQHAAWRRRPPASTWRTTRRCCGRDPLGVCVGIAPWNYPLNMATWKLGPALAAGNTFILKPSELTPLTALKLAEIAADIFPPGVFNVVCGHGSTVGDAIVKHPGDRDGVAHRRRQHRQAHRQERGRHAQARAPRAGRQGAGHRVRRRRRRRARRDARPRPPIYNSGQDCTAPGR